MWLKSSHFYGCSLHISSQSKIILILVQGDKWEAQSLSHTERRSAPHRAAETWDRCQLYHYCIYEGPQPEVAQSPAASSSRRPAKPNITSLYGARSCVDLFGYWINRHSFPRRSTKTYLAPRSLGAEGRIEVCITTGWRPSYMHSINSGAWIYETFNTNFTRSI